MPRVARQSSTDAHRSPPDTACDADGVPTRRAARAQHAPRAALRARGAGFRPPLDRKDAIRCPRTVLQYSARTGPGVVVQRFLFLFLFLTFEGTASLVDLPWGLGAGLVALPLERPGQVSAARMSGPLADLDSALVLSVYHHALGCVTRDRAVSSERSLGDSCNRSHHRSVMCRCASAGGRCCPLVPA